MVPDRVCENPFTEFTREDPASFGRLGDTVPSEFEFGTDLVLVEDEWLAMRPWSDRTGGEPPKSEFVSGKLLPPRTLELGSTVDVVVTVLLSVPYKEFEKETLLEITSEAAVSKDTANDGITSLEEFSCRE